MNRNRPLLLWVALLTSVSISAQSKAGFRQLKPDEAAFLTRVHFILAGAIPQKFYNWQADHNEDDFDALKLWCANPKTTEDHTGDCPVSLGKTEPYNISYTIEFRMPEQESRTLLLAAYKKITDFNSPGQIAAALKSTAVCRLSIGITTNVLPSVINKLSYCPKVPPAGLSLPVPAKLAIIARHPEDCPIMAAGKADMTADYYDTALVFLGKPVVKRAAEQRAGVLLQTGYSAGFDRTKIGRMTIQNMVISIHGDVADINTVIKMIDWEKLYYLVNK